MVALADAPASAIEAQQESYEQPAPAKAVRERRTTYKKRPDPTSVTQKDLWG
jgi:hypothetical protein